MLARRERLSRSLWLQQGVHDATQHDLRSPRYSRSWTTVVLACWGSPSTIPLACSTLHLHLLKAAYQGVAHHHILHQELPGVYQIATLHQRSWRLTKIPAFAQGCCPPRVAVGMTYVSTSAFCSYMKGNMESQMNMELHMELHRMQGVDRPVAGSGRHNTMVRSMEVDRRQRGCAGGLAWGSWGGGGGGCHCTLCTQSSCPTNRASRKAVYSPLGVVNWGLGAYLPQHQPAWTKNACC